MRIARVSLPVCLPGLLIVVALTSPVAAQPAGPAVERLFRISGQLAPGGGAVQPVHFALYEADTGGTPLWEETQSAAVDAAGRFTVLLGAASAGGLSPDLFADGRPRWLGIRGEGAVEQPRTLLTAVPYALVSAKSGDADTLGGLPASAFLRAAEAPAASATHAASSAAVRESAPLTLGNIGRIGKFTSTVALGDSVMFENAFGRIGLGTTTPLDSMHVRFSDATGAFTGYAVQNMGSSATSYSGMLFYDHTGALGQFQGFNNSTKEYRINNIAPAGSINFMTGSTSRFKVATNGFIGIGNNAPDAEVHIGNGLGSPTLKLDGLRDGIGAGIRWTEEWITDFGIEARFDGRVDGAGALVFRGIQDGVPSVDNLLVIEPYSTTGTGVGIGVAQPLDRLHVAGDVRIGTGATGCVRDADATVIAGTCSSDLRFKTDVEAFRPLLDRFAKLTPVTYQWRASEFPSRAFGTRASWGFVAQEVQDLFPDLVATDAQGYLAVNYSKVPLLTVQAVKELKAENDALKARLAALEAAVAALPPR